MNHIVIISYPRSGTHLLIDLIRNNFSDFHYPYISFEGIKKRILIKQKALIARISESNRIFKTHDFPNILFSKVYKKNMIIEYIFSNSNFIYVSRDGRDVLVSQYYRKLTECKNMKDLSFTTFLKTNINFKGSKGTPPYLWSLFNKEWLNYANKKILEINFSELIEEPEKVLDKISHFINRKPNPYFIDVKLINKGELNFPHRFGNGYVNPEEIARTSIYFRKGIVGDYKNYFSTDDLIFYDQETNNTTTTK